MPTYESLITKNPNSHVPLATWSPEHLKGVDFDPSDVLAIVTETIAPGVVTHIFAYPTLIRLNPDFDGLNIPVNRLLALFLKYWRLDRVTPHFETDELAMRHFRDNNTRIEVLEDGSFTQAVRTMMSNVTNSNGTPEPSS